MECLALIQQAENAGLQLRIDVGRLVIRGPKRCAEIAARLMERKAEVIAAMEANADYEGGGERAAIQNEARIADVEGLPCDDAADAGRYATWVESFDGDGCAVLTHPDAEGERIDAAALPPCSLCGSLSLWQTAAGTWRCCRCEPPTKAATLRDLAETIRRRFPGVKTTTADAANGKEC